MIPSGSCGAQPPRGVSLVRFLKPPRDVHSLFFLNVTATTEIYTLSLHDALPILPPRFSRNFLVSGVRPSVRILRLSLVTPQPVALQWLKTGMRMSSRMEGTPMIRTSPDCPPELDRKSTRLNSSHVRISYAVFCLK